MAAVRGYAEPLRILCARELQHSIRDSVHTEIARAIANYPWLENHYTIGESFIRGANGTEFLFRGLRHNHQEIKSLSGVNICWIEEAESVSEASWQVLVPTIREPNSEIWATWNPASLDSPVRKRFVLEPTPGTKVIQLNYLDNPWFPETLEADRIHMLKTNPDLYTHVWDGECITRSDAQIFKDKWSVQEFVSASDWDGPYIGGDWGFANDPTTLIESWIHNRCLWIERESYSIGLDLDRTAERWKLDIPGCEDYVIRADCSRPESISYVKRDGIPRLIAVEKWQNSVKDGIAYLHSFDKIIIHPRCTHMIEEARLYSYKVDRLTNDVLPTVIEGKYDHCWDAVRYSLQPLIKNNSAGYRLSTGSLGMVRRR